MEYIAQQSPMSPCGGIASLIAKAAFIANYLASISKQRSDPFQSRSKENRDKYNKQNPHKQKLT